MSLTTRTKVKPPRSLSATVSLTSGFAVNLRWTPIESGAPLSYYVIYRDGEELTAGVTVSTYRDADVSGGQFHDYQVSTVLVTETESDPGNLSTATVPGYPEWQSGWSLSLQQSSSQSVSGYATDPLGYSLTFSRVGGTAPAGVTVNSLGLVSVSTAAGGSYTLILRADNGYLYTDMTVTITVVATNVAPVFTVFQAFSTLPSSGGVIQFSASDPEGQAVLYSLTSARAGITINSTTGLVTVAASAAGTTGRITVMASDGLLSTTTDCTVNVAAVATTLIRFAPGHYFRPGLNDTVASVLTKISTYGSHLKGVLYLHKWRDLEPTQGNYSWTNLDQVVNACSAAGKKALIRIQDRSFNSSNPLAVCPDYLSSSGYTYVNSTKAVSGAALWRSGAMDRNIAAYNAISNRYGSATTLVGLVGEESTYGPSTGMPADYSAAAVINQEIRRLQAIRAYAPQLPWYIMVNYLSGDDASFSNLQRYFAAARADLGVYMCGGPDLLTADPPPAPGQDIITGVVGGINHVGTYLSATSTENKDFNDGATIAQLYDDAYNIFQGNIMSWSTVSSQWTATVEPYLQTHPVRTTVPSALTGLVTQL